MPDRLFDWRVFAAGTALVSAATVTTPDLDLQMLDRIVALDLRVTGAGPSFQVQYAVGKQRSDASNVIDYGAFINIGAVVAAAGETNLPFPTPLGRFIKVQIVGGGGNGADTVIEGDLVCAEKV